MFLWPPATIVWLLARAHSKCQISSEFELLFSKIMSLVRNPSKYGVSSSHADEDTLPTATQTSFFQKGREFESRYVNHHYTEEERQKLGTFESVDYLPPHSAVYKVRCNFRGLSCFVFVLVFFHPACTRQRVTPQ